MINITSLPRSSGKLTMQPVPRGADGSPPRRLDTVLIIDDDPTLRLALACMLADPHRQLVLAQNADDALEHLSLIDPDVILCDYLLEGTNGREFCQLVKSQARWHYVPIIAVTRMDAPAIVADLLKSGADDVLIKPVRGDELRARVQCSLRTRARYLQLGRAAGAVGDCRISISA